MLKYVVAEGFKEMSNIEIYGHIIFGLIILSFIVTIFLVARKIKEEDKPGDE